MCLCTGITRNTYTMYIHVRTMCVCMWLCTGILHVSTWVCGTCCHTWMALHAALCTHTTSHYNHILSLQPHSEITFPPQNNYVLHIFLMCDSQSPLRAKSELAIACPLHNIEGSHKRNRYLKTRPNVHKDTQDQYTLKIIIHVYIGTMHALHLHTHSSAHTCMYIHTFKWIHISHVHVCTYTHSNTSTFRVNIMYLLIIIIYLLFSHNRVTDACMPSIHSFIRAHICDRIWENPTFAYSIKIEILLYLASIMCEQWASTILPSVSYSAL